MSYLSKLLVPAIPLIFFSNAAFANEYHIFVETTQFSGSPTEVISTGSYCMDSDGLGDHSLATGKADWDVNTKTEVFSGCGWKHSSATFHLVYIDSKGKKDSVAEFEFYKPLGKSPYLIQHSAAANIKCTYDDLRVSCEPATPVIYEPHLKRGTPSSTEQEESQSAE